MTTTEEIHPYNDLKKIPAETRLLIVGTAPPPRFAQSGSDEGELDFYYGSKSNQLWTKIFPDIFQKSFPKNNLTEATARSFLNDHQIWMHDICQKYAREENDALDQHLIPIQFSDLRLIFESYPAIDTLAFTGGYAEKWSGKQMEGQQLIPTEQFWKGLRHQKIPRRRRLRIKLEKTEREIEMHTLPSPSRRSAKTSIKRKIELYRESFIDIFKKLS